jgi:L-ribulose-5-phosphate 3-epimerase
MSKVVGLVGGDVGVHFDICNSAYIKEDLPGAIRTLRSRLRNVHISDFGDGEFKDDRPGTGMVGRGRAAALRDIG